MLELTEIKSGSWVVIASGALLLAMMFARGRKVGKPCAQPSTHLLTAVHRALGRVQEEKYGHAISILDNFMSREGMSLEVGIRCEMNRIIQCFEIGRMTEGTTSLRHLRWKLEAQS